MTKQENEREVIVDIDGLVVETKFENGSQIYSTDKISIETLKVSTPSYVDSFNKTVDKKEIELVKIVKWDKKYTKGSSDIILSKIDDMIIGKFAFLNMCEAIAKMQKNPA